MNVLISTTCSEKPESVLSPCLSWYEILITWPTQIEIKPPNRFTASYLSIVSHVWTFCILWEHSQIQKLQNKWQLNCDLCDCKKNPTTNTSIRLVGEEPIKNFNQISLVRVTLTRRWVAIVVSLNVQRNRSRCIWKKAIHLSKGEWVGIWRESEEGDQYIFPNCSERSRRYA